MERIVCNNIPYFLKIIKINKIKGPVKSQKNTYGKN